MIPDWFGLLDFIILPGLCEWIYDIDRLGELFPPPSGFGRWMGIPTPVTRGDPSAMMEM